MKSIKIPFLGLMLLGSIALEAQVAPAQVKYRRSSLHMIMLDDKGLVNADLIKKTFKGMPIPEKFNDHSLKDRSFDPAAIVITDADRKETAKKESKAGSISKGIASSATGGLVDTTNTKDLPIKFDKYFTTNDIAKNLVAKWFNRSAKGTFDMKLIGERGSYDASALDIATAKSSKRGLSAVSDAGVELIGNTFVVVTRFNYISMEELAAAAKKTGAVAGKLGGAIGGKAGAAGNLAGKAAGAAMDQAKGYVVQTTSYLYKLVWNDSIEAVFYQNYWIDDNSFDQAKKDAFDKSNLFTLELIGDEKANANVLSSAVVKKTDDELVAKATINAFDAVIAKLQKKYEIFRTKTPLFSGDPITAKIGLKEGLEEGDKFEVLEQVLDEKTGKTKYEKKGVIKVEKGMIWDNRFGAEDEPKIEGVTPATPLDRTTFSGGKGYYSGMLIRQK
ncbi:MAG: hypothetical protein IPL10_07425 [Bacteroidetes bacterium]|jgi:hypothetical protein|nr:hypothetical protein [Bacteroidota bacterium]